MAGIVESRPQLSMNDLALFIAGLRPARPQVDRVLQRSRRSPWSASAEEKQGKRSEGHAGFRRGCGAARAIAGSSRPRILGDVACVRLAPGIGFRRARVRTGVGASVWGWENPQHTLDAGPVGRTVATGWQVNGP